MITADQLLAHLVGDYVLQSDWMATEKTKRSWAAFVHACVYTMCFVPLVWEYEVAAWPGPLLAIGLSHFVIDRWRLARFVVYAKNFMAPKRTWDRRSWAGEPFSSTRWWHPWSECAATGYHKDRPVWLATWLLILADNSLHVAINGLALWWFGVVE